MKETKIIEFNHYELLQILQDYYNKINNTNHSLQYYNGATVVTLEIAMWNKDEKTH